MRSTTLRRIRPALFLGIALLLLSPPSCAPRLTDQQREVRFGLRFGLAKFADYDPLAVVEKLEGWGLDYAEPAVLQVMTYSDAEFADAVRRNRSAGARVEVMNWFVPGSVRLTGPDVDAAKVRDYMEKSLARAEALNAKVIVFGSPAARSYPEGYPKHLAWGQLVAFLRACGEHIAAKGYDITIGIEPLRKAESNIVNTVGEALDLAGAVGHPRVKIIVDFFHLAEENEDPDVILAARDEIVHLHISNPAGGKRLFCRDEAEDPRYAKFFRNLKTIGYAGRISLEANPTDLEADARAGVAFLRRMYEKYR